MTEEKKPVKAIVKGSRRARYAAKVRKIYPIYLGRDTNTLSNNYMKHIGKTNKIDFSD